MPPWSSVDDKLGTGFGKKIDLNNCSVRDFRSYPGMYPGIAGKIVRNKPYSSVDDVLCLDLTSEEKEVFERNRENFVVRGVGSSDSDFESRF
jgi:photosystem II PsbU protein